MSLAGSSPHLTLCKKEPESGKAMSVSSHWKVVTGGLERALPSKLSLNSGPTTSNSVIDLLACLVGTEQQPGFHSSFSSHGITYFSCSESWSRWLRTSTMKGISLPCTSPTLEAGKQWEIDVEFQFVLRDSNVSCSLPLHIHLSFLTGWPCRFQPLNTRLQSSNHIENA